MWWLIGLLVVIAVVATVVVGRARRARRIWEGQFANAVSESTWLAHELLPDTLSAPDAAERRATWSAYRPRVEALMNVLNETSASAPHGRQDEVGRLRDAVQELGFTTDSYAATGLDDKADLAAVRQAQRWLEDALHAIQWGTEIRPR
jgi:hypothetical protein